MSDKHRRAHHFPKPDTPYGYSEAYLQGILGTRFGEFAQDHRGIAPTYTPNPTSGRPIKTYPVEQVWSWVEHGKLV